MPLVNLPGLSLHVACGAAARKLADDEGLKLVGEAELADFHQALRASHGTLLLRDATFGLVRADPDKSARRRLTGAQGFASLAILGLAAGLWLLLPEKALWLIGSLVAALFFLAVIALRLLCLLPQPVRPRPLLRPIEDGELPAYSVLVPLFREISVLNQLLTALVHIDYPAEKLDIKLILEESDIAMRRAVAAIELPAQFEVIVVPGGRPQTKPRALNYGLRFARGELLTIYDAEDIPEPGQLRLAAETFAASSSGVACLQAELAFYNPNENWLTRQFTIEYATLFGLLLPTLAGYGLPLPLGGTSNHFRVAALRRVGAWDPFNVTEDADLGLRLARAGYGTLTIDSRTYEEATVRPGNWLQQRARWLKGFLITWLVHMRAPRRLAAELGPSGFWASQALTIGIFGSALLHPLCMGATVALFIVEPTLPADAGFPTIALAGLNLMVLVTGYGATMLAGVKALRRLRIRGWILPILSTPLYWLLISVAAWLALWQFLTDPYYWNKTEHGLSSLQKRRG
ncbi:MAG: glycosyltransferase [Rhizobiales bacterium]|nr:glycosyltransferase [Hyphomicrobiales bacterium]